MEYKIRIVNGYDGALAYYLNGTIHLEVVSEFMAEYILNHEVLHWILDKQFDRLTSVKLDNIKRLI